MPLLGLMFRPTAKLSNGEVRCGGYPNYICPIYRMFNLQAIEHISKIVHNMTFQDLNAFEGVALPSDRYAQIALIAGLITDKKMDKEIDFSTIPVADMNKYIVDAILVN